MELLAAAAASAVAAAGVISVGPAAPAAIAAAPAEQELPPDVSRMIWQRMWRVESAVCIQRAVRRAFQSRLGAAHIYARDNM